MIWRRGPAVFATTVTAVATATSSSGGAVGWTSYRRPSCRVKLGHLAGWIEARRRIASRYRERLTGLPLTLPVEHAAARHVYYLYTVRHPRRDQFIKAMTELGVGTAVHYPIPVPDQPLFLDAGGGAAGPGWPESARAAREVVSLPCYPELCDDEIDTVVQAVHEACRRTLD